MPQSDAFAFKNSGLNAFLFAEVGNEVNGSPLTILSVLARLGMDPWIEAARLTKMPKAALIDSLANSISQMPLSPQALTDARTTATRLVQLLPSQVLSPLKRETMSLRKPRLPGWLPYAVVVAALVFAIVFEMMPSSTTRDVIAPLVDHTTTAPRTPTK